MKKSIAISGIVLVAIVSAAYVSLKFYHERNEAKLVATNDFSEANADFNQKNFDTKLQTYSKNQLNYQTKVNDLFSQAEKLDIHSWTKMSSQDDLPPFHVMITSDNHVLIDDNLKDYFAFFLNYLTNSVSFVESISRFLQATKNLPEPAKSEVRALFKKYVLVEINLMDRVKEGAPQTKTLLEKLQTIPINKQDTRNDILHKIQLNAQEIQQNKEITMQAIGGDDILSLYKSSNQRANNEINLSLINTDNSIKIEDKIPKMLSILDIKPQLPPSLNNGGIRLAYSSIDASVLSNTNLTDEQKDQIRLENFGPIYLEEYKKIYR